MAKDILGDKLTGSETSLGKGQRTPSHLWRSEAGRINLLAVFLLLLAAAAVYGAVLFAPPYIEYYKLEEKVRSVANLAHREKDDEVLRRELMRESKILELDLPYDAFSVQRDPQGGRWVEIGLRYARVVELVPFGQEVTLHFDIQVVEQL